MTDVLIRDVPEDVLSGIDARAADMGLSRVEYIRRRLAQDARAARLNVTRPPRTSRAGAHNLADEELMREVWR